MVGVEAKCVPAAACALQGFVVGFSGAELYCLTHAQTPMMQTVHTPLSAHMRDLLQQGEIDRAYQVGCAHLGKEEAPPCVLH